MKTTNNITPATTNLTPEEFITMFLPLLIAMKVTRENDTAHYERNEETGKIELHIDKDAYRAMPDEEKQRLWDAFHWSRANGCWISRYINADDIAQPPAPVTPAKAAPKPKAEKKPKTERAEIISPAQKFTPAAVGTISSEDIEHALRRGSVTEGGKIRIAAFYASNHTPDEAKRFLKEEYGVSGYTHDFPDGDGGMVDCNASGIEIRKGGIVNPKAVAKLSWVTVHAYLHDMIKRGEYLTDKEQEKYNAIKRQYKGKMPTPRPRCGFPDAKKSA